MMQIESEDSKHPARKEAVLDETIKQQAISMGLFE